MLMIARCSPFYYLARCLKIAEKSLIQLCELSKLRLHFEFLRKAKNAQFGQFLKT